MRSSAQSLVNKLAIYKLILKQNLLVLKSLLNFPIYHSNHMSQYQVNKNVIIAEKSQLNQVLSNTNKGLILINN